MDMILYVKDARRSSRQGGGIYVPAAKV